MENKTQQRHYFDWAASAIPDYSLYNDSFPFGNPSSAHKEGQEAAQALEGARARCALALGVPSSAIYFTSGGTESNCISLYSLIARKSSASLIASASEHPSITENLKKLQFLGKESSLIPVDSSGRVTCENLKSTIEKQNNARFVAIMSVNNETGTLNDIKSLQSVLKKNGAPVHFHCDIVQSIGKIPVNLTEWEVDSASLSAHKIGGPRGIGILYLKKPLEVLYSGGGQEKNIRPGTENTAGALILASCLEKYLHEDNFKKETAKAGERWAFLLKELSKIQRCRFIPYGRQIDDPGFSPFILQAAFRDIPGEVMVRALDELGFAVSTGSACSSSSPERRVLAAMGIDESLRLEGIRISQGWTTTEEEIGLLIEAIKEVLKFL